MIYCSPAERRETEERWRNKKRSAGCSADTTSPHEKVASEKVEEMWKDLDPGTLAKATPRSSGKALKMTQKQGARSDTSQVSSRIMARI